MIAIEILMLKHESYESCTTSNQNNQNVNRSTHCTTEPRSYSFQSAWHYILRGSKVRFWAEKCVRAVVLNIQAFKQYTILLYM